MRQNKIRSTLKSTPVQNLLWQLFRVTCFQLSLVEPKPKLSLWPITKDTDNPVGQSKLEANTCRQCKARENVRKRVTIGFDFISDWLGKWREYV